MKYKYFIIGALILLVVSLSLNGSLVTIEGFTGDQLSLIYKVLDTDQKIQNTSNQATQKKGLDDQLRTLTELQKTISKLEMDRLGLTKILELTKKIINRTYNPFTSSYQSIINEKALLTKQLKNQIPPLTPTPMGPPSMGPTPTLTPTPRPTDVPSKLRTSPYSQPPTPPKIPYPKNIRVSNITSTSFTLTYDPVDLPGLEPITRYIIIFYELVEGGNFIEILVLNTGTDTTFSLKELKPSTTYKYKIRAENSTSVSDYSPDAKITTLAPSMEPSKFGPMPNPTDEPSKLRPTPYPQPPMETPRPPSTPPSGVYYQELQQNIINNLNKLGDQIWLTRLSFEKYVQ